MDSNSGMPSQVENDDQNIHDQSDNKSIRASFFSLAPVKTIGDEANNEIYFSALDFALEDGSIKNVAITGNYGAGKSTLIELYKEKTQKNRPNRFLSFLYSMVILSCAVMKFLCNNLKFLCRKFEFWGNKFELWHSKHKHKKLTPHFIHISLASFSLCSTKELSQKGKKEVNGKNKVKSESCEEDESRTENTVNSSNYTTQTIDTIETSILQQLFYHAAGKELPKSNVVRIEDSSWQNTFFYIWTYFILFFLVCVILIGIMPGAMTLFFPLESFIAAKYPDNTNNIFLLAR